MHRPAVSPFAAALLFALIASALRAAPPPGVAGPPVVVASVMPVHALAAGVMAGVGTPSLIVRGYGSPHTYQMRPSDAVALSGADVVFWVGENLETFLRRPLQTLPRAALIVELGALPTVRRLPTRRGGVWEPDAHDEGGANDHEADRKAAARGREHVEPDDNALGDETGPGAHDAEDHRAPVLGGFDGHIWLDIDNTIAITEAMVAALSARDPANAQHYAANGARQIERLRDLDRRLVRRLAAVREVPYAVFHDAFRYLEARYGLNAVGAVTVSPERKPGARRLQALRERIRALGARCLFREPQFESLLVQTVLEGTGAHSAVLDPLGGDREPGPEAYFKMMEHNAQALAECLGGG